MKSRRVSKCETLRCRLSAHLLTFAERSKAVESLKRETLRYRLATRPDHNTKAADLKRGGPRYLVLSSWTMSTNVTTFSYGVSGSRPCPRLKMCPGLPAA